MFYFRSNVLFVEQLFVSCVGYMASRGTADKGCYCLFEGYNPALSAETEKKVRNVLG
jgi:hypothetical protein